MALRLKLSLSEKGTKLNNSFKTRNKLRTGIEISDKEISQFVVTLIMPLFVFAFKFPYHGKPKNFLGKVTFIVTCNIPKVDLQVLIIGAKGSEISIHYLF